MKIGLPINILLLMSLVCGGIVPSSTQTSEYSPHVCAFWRSEESCVGGNKALTTTAVGGSYTHVTQPPSRIVRNGKILIEKNIKRNITYNLEFVDSALGLARYRFEQPQHGGGDCNCVTIYFDQNCSTTTR